MALHIRDAETDRLVRQLAEIKKVGLTEAVHLAVKNELKKLPLSERIRPIQERLAKFPDVEDFDEKAFMDELNGGI